jgi:hypothetical protein
MRPVGKTLRQLRIVGLSADTRMGSCARAALRCTFSPLAKQGAKQRSAAHCGTRFMSSFAQHVLRKYLEAAHSNAAVGT